ncbi:MAG: hypothetical protein RL081_1455, partial [Pseudomonadota bacterium]
HQPRFGTDDFVVFRLGQRLDQFIGRVRARVDELGQLLQEGALVFLVGQARGMWIGH